MFQTPILFLIFNREDTTRKVFEVIRQQKPKYLYVAADGARKHKPNEAEICRRVRDIIRVDWDCELKTLYRDENLGCKMAVSSAITWFFENVEQGIILEDDCLPDPSFFPYCEELLNRYKDDTRICHIAGTNHWQGAIAETQSYDFSYAKHTWGWATWRRVWKNYDVDLKFWNEQKDKRPFLFRYKSDYIYCLSCISDVLDNKINTWDVQYGLMTLSQNQMCIFPAINLVTNLGIGNPLATHTLKKNKNFLLAQTMSFPLKHPLYVMSNQIIDKRAKLFSWKRLIRYLFRLY